MFLHRSLSGVLDGVPLLEIAYADFPGLNGHERFGEGGGFSGGNNFVMVPEGGVRNVVHRLTEQILAEKFLREVVPRDALKYVKILELVFPPFQTP